MTREYSVCFPMIRDADGKLAKVYVANHGTRDKRWCSIHPKARRQAEEIKTCLELIRFRERPETRDISVAVGFKNADNTPVDGRSYTLSLALADRMVRFLSQDKLEKWPVIVATGVVIEREHELYVQKVDGFEQKLDLLIAEELPEGSLFIHPKDNRIPGQKLAALQEQGIVPLAVDWFENLAANLWQVDNQRQDDVSPETGEKPDEDRKTAVFFQSSLFQKLLTTFLLLGSIGTLAGSHCWLPFPWCEQCIAPMEQSIFQWCMGDFQPLPKTETAVRVTHTSHATGQELPLINDQSVKTRDWLTLYIEPNQDVYIYFFWLDSVGKLREKLEDDFPQRSRHLAESVGQRFQLQIDDKTGTETLFLVVFKKRAHPLLKQYQALLKARQDGLTTEAAMLQSVLLDYLRSHQLLRFHHLPEEDLLMKKSLQALHLAGLLSVVPFSQAQQTKGATPCETGKECITTGFNRDAKNTKGVDVAFNSLQPGQKMSGTAVIAGEVHPNVDIDYRYGGINGTDKAMDNDSRLYSGDRFTIELTANESVYVYLYQQDTNGQLQEFLTLSGHDNHLAAGENLFLPSRDRHFVLDDNPGKEYIDIIVSRQPLTGLEAKYRNGLKREDLEVATTKGVRISNNPSLATKARTDSSPSAGKIIGCPADTACRETFVIHHLALK